MYQELIERPFQYMKIFKKTIRNLLLKELLYIFLVRYIYVEGYVTYKKNHSIHDILVYGYEDEYVYASDYFDFQTRAIENTI